MNTLDNISNKVIASGNIPNTNLNININTDNSVNVISKTNVSDNNKVVFNNGSSVFISAIYNLTNNKVIIAYQDVSNLNYGTVIVGTVENNSITFGNPVIFNNGNTDSISITYDIANDKVIIAYRDYVNSGSGTVILGTIKNNSIILSNPIVFNKGDTEFISATYDSVNNKIVIAYRNNRNSYYGTAIVGSVNGSTIVFGNPVTFNSNNTPYVSTIYDPVNNKIVIAYCSYDNSYYGKAIVGIIDGLSISFNDPVVFNIGPTYHIVTTYDTANSKIIIAYKDASNLHYGTAIVGSVENNTIIFGKPIIFNNNDTDFISITYSTISNKIVIACCNYNNSYCGKAIVGTVDGLNILFDNTIVFNNNDTWSTSCVYDSINNKVIIAYNNVSNPCEGTAIVIDKSCI